MQTIVATGMIAAKRSAYSLMKFMEGSCAGWWWIALRLRL
jgi:hypothetical protein